MDITELILVQHQQQRRLFAALDDIAPTDHAALSAVWRWLSRLLEVHAAAEEAVFYPRLLEVGRRRKPNGDTADETKDAIKDHNDIRDAVRTSREHPVGSPSWWEAVRAARTANSDHMAEEERDDLADFRRYAGLDVRHEIAARFLTFEADYPDGAANRDKSPQEYVSRHR